VRARENGGEALRWREDGLTPGVLGVEGSIFPGKSEPPTEKRSLNGRTIRGWPLPGTRWSLRGDAELHREGDGWCCWWSSRPCCVGWWAGPAQGGYWEDMVYVPEGV